jgi:hypothetical protein
MRVPMRTSRSLLGVTVNAQVKTYEQRLADLIRRLGTEHEGEVIATARALGRMLAAKNVSFTDLGDAVEKLATGGLTQAEMERIHAAGYARGLADAEHKHAEAQAVFGIRSDGSTDWEAVALHCQKHKHLIEAKHHQFVDDMASRMSWGREPSDRQGKYLLSLFRGVGGRMT